MLIYSIISVCAVIALLLYILIFFVRYRVVPQSLSVTAEYPHQLYYWQCTICTIFGWLAFYFPTVYTFSEYGYWPLLLNAGVSGLALSGYYSYSSAEESKRLLTIHKVGSFSGAVLVSLFYIIFGSWVLVLSTMSVAVLLGLLIKGYRYRMPSDNSLVFWLEIAIISIVSTDLIKKFLEII